MKRTAIALHVLGAGIIAFGATRWIIWRSGPPPVQARITSEDYPDGFIQFQNLAIALFTGIVIVGIAAFLWSRANTKTPNARLV